jgi:hypothetical protein
MPLFTAPVTCDEPQCAQIWTSVTVVRFWMDGQSGGEESHQDQQQPQRDLEPDSRFDK